jgi:hypothetical protein
MREPFLRWNRLVPSNSRIEHLRGNPQHRSKYLSFTILNKSKITNKSFNDNLIYTPFAFTREYSWRKPFHAVNKTQLF